MNTERDIRTLLIGAGPDLWAIRRGPDRWDAHVTFEGIWPRCLAVARGRRSAVYCGTDRGLWISEDAGASWRRITIDTDSPQRVTAVSLGGTAEPSGHHTIYIGTEPSRLARSGDSGRTWVHLDGLLTLPSRTSWSFPPRPETHHVRAIATDPRGSEQLWVAIEAGALIRSPDAGCTWVDRVPGGPRDTHTLEIDPDVPGRILVAAGDGFFESADGGRTWERDEDGLEHRYIWNLSMLPESRTLVISAASSARQAHDVPNSEAWIYRREEGTRWEPVMGGSISGPGTTIASFGRATGETEEIYAVNNGGVFRSDDDGRSWVREPIAWPAALRSRRVHPVVFV
jgi:photosystem II stability/assembly factor-like uncharacterized protein